jgi:hypothetical protein
VQVVEVRATYIGGVHTLRLPTSVTPPDPEQRFAGQRQFVTQDRLDLEVAASVHVFGATAVRVRHGRLHVL